MDGGVEPLAGLFGRCKGGARNPFMRGEGGIKGPRISFPHREKKKHEKGEGALFLGIKKQANFSKKNLGIWTWVLKTPPELAVHLSRAVHLSPHIGGVWGRLVENPPPLSSHVLTLWGFGREGGGE